MKISSLSAIGLVAMVGLAACAPKPIEPEKAYDKYGNVVMIVSPDGTVAPATSGGGGGTGGSGNQNQNQNTNNNTNQNQNSNNNQSQSQNQSGKS